MCIQRLEYKVKTRDLFLEPLLNLILKRACNLGEIRTINLTKSLYLEMCMDILKLSSMIAASIAINLPESVVAMLYIELIFNHIS